MFIIGLATGFILAVGYLHIAMWFSRKHGFLPFSPDTDFVVPTKKKKKATIIFPKTDVEIAQEKKIEENNARGIDTPLSEL